MKDTEKPDIIIGIEHRKLLHFSYFALQYAHGLHIDQRKSKDETKKKGIRHSYF
jgi:hypothetical protein